MQIGSDGKGTGRLSEAAAKQALEAAERARKEAAERAREAAAERAREAAAQRAREAAKAAAEQQKKAHTQRLNETAKHLDAHPMPWQEKATGKIKETGKLADKGASLVQTGVGMVLGSTAIVAYKNFNSVKGKVQQIKNVADDMRKAVEATGGAAKSAVQATGGAAENAADVAAKAHKANEALGNKALNGMSKLQKLDSGLRVLSGVNSALNLRKSVGALKDGATLMEVNQVAADAMGALRGADSATKLLRNGAGFIGGKLNPVLAIAGAASDSIRRVDNLKNWSNLSTKDKVANIAYLAGNVADVVGAVTPPPINIAAKAVGAGLALVGMASENFDSIKKGAEVAVGAAQEAVHKVGDAAKQAADGIKSFAKKFFSGL